MKASLALLALLFVLPASSAFAQPSRPRVVLITPGGAPSPRLSAELDALGLESIVLPGEEGTPPDPDALTELARTHEAVAAIHVERDGTRASVWVVDRVTGKVVLREVVLPDDERDAQALVAVRAVELLRASLLELEADHETRGEVAPAPAVTRLAQRPRQPPPVAIDLGLGVLATTEGVPPHALVQGAVFLRATPFLELGVGGAATLAPATVQGPEGTADVWLGVARVGVRLTPDEPSWLIVPSVEVGGSAMILSAHGRATAPYTSLGGDASRVAPYLGVGGLLRASDVVSVRVDVMATMLPLPIDIRFSGRVAAAYGPLLLGATLSIVITP